MLFPDVFTLGKDKYIEKKEIDSDRFYKKAGQLPIEVDCLKKDRLSGMNES